jgi:membrane protease YdiL (CAAX protease family)
VFLGNLGAKSSRIDISGWYILPAIIVTVILAPIGEELIFRSSLVYGFDNGKPIVAVLLSSLAFTLMHMSPMQTFYQFALGVALAVLIMRSKNVICSIVAHATSNLAVIILSLVSLPPIPLFNPLTIVLAVVILVFCFLLVAFILKSISPSSENVEIIKDSVVKTEDKTMGVVAISLSIVICLIMWILAFI